MTSSQAESAVSIAAFVVASVWAYRRLVNPSLSGTVSSTPHFVLGFGFTFISLSLIAQAAPELGGMLAVLVAAGDLLVNGTGLATDLTNSLNQTARSVR